MRRFGSATHHAGAPDVVGLPAGVEELLVDVVADGFSVYCCGPKTAPRALVACYEWAEWVDLLTVVDFERVVTARVPTRDRRVDLFDPGIVVWAYEGPPPHAVGALLNLVHPAHRNAPTASYPAPPGLRIPRVAQRPMTIQLPTSGWAGVRAVRLTAAMRTGGGGDRPVSATGPGRTEQDRRLAADCESDTRGSSSRRAVGYHRPRGGGRAAC
jgi:hypothetical protein